MTYANRTVCRRNHVIAAEVRIAADEANFKVGRRGDIIGYTGHIHHNLMPPIIAHWLTTGTVRLVSLSSRLPVGLGKYYHCRGRRRRINVADIGYTAKTRKAVVIGPGCHVIIFVFRPDPETILTRWVEASNHIAGVNLPGGRRAVYVFKLVINRPAGVGQQW